MVISIFSLENRECHGSSLVPVSFVQIHQCRGHRQDISDDGWSIVLIGVFPVKDVFVPKPEVEAKSVDASGCVSNSSNARVRESAGISRYPTVSAAADE